MIRRRVVVHGHVQGVFFRETVRRRAEAAGVAGWVRNRDDGSVEAAFEGDQEAVERLIHFCERGPRGRGSTGWTSPLSSRRTSPASQSRADVDG